VIDISSFVRLLPGLPDCIHESKVVDDSSYCLSLSAVLLSQSFFHCGEGGILYCWCLCSPKSVHASEKTDEVPFKDNCMNIEKKEERFCSLL
jgi:hypothetical protein